MRNVVEQWDLTFNASGVSAHLLYMIRGCRRIADKYGFTLNLKTTFNFLVFKIVQFRFTGHCTEKYANKFKNKILKYCFQYA